MRLLLLLSALLTAAGTLRAAGPALSNGEGLTYRMGWGILNGEIKIMARTAPAENNQPRLQVITTTSTRGLARALYQFDGRGEALFDAGSGRLLSWVETSKTDSKENKATVTFDYTKAAASYVNETNPAKNTTLAMPAGEPLDIIMSLVQTRAWDLKPGEKRDALVILDDEFYELTIHAERYEQVRTELGTFQTLVLVPRMEKTPPKGMFKRGYGVRVWISQDGLRLPVKFQVEFKFGAGVATLTSYQLPIVPETSANGKTATTP